MAVKKEATATQTNPKLKDLILVHANAHADLGNKTKAQAYRDLVAESEMSTMQAIAVEIAKNGVSTVEQLILDLAVIVISAD